MALLDDYLQLMVKKDASDLFIASNSTPYFKIHGRMHPVGKTSLDGDQVAIIAYGLMTPEQVQDFKNHPELNLGISLRDIGRFRINIFQQRNELGLVIRNIKTEIPAFKTLGLPDVLKELIVLKKGLVLFVGATSSGKSTTIASLLDYRNQTQAGHIISIEDPIEFIFQNKKSLVNQREVGIDTSSYGEALKNTLRQSPDAIFIGEIRSRDTMDYAMSFSETGHICVSTMHATNVAQALDRIIHFFPNEVREQILLDLSLNLAAIVSQRLIPSIDGKRVPAVEVMTASPLIKDLIRQGKLDEIHDVIKKSSNAGMITFDDALYNLYHDYQITEEEALQYADSKNNLRLRINLERGSGPDDSDLSLKEKQE